jgi:putative addiction module component (TIGR02574 family)
MNYEELLRECLSLSVEDRIQLAGDIWDSIGDAEFVIPEEHRIELERRIAAYEADPSGGVPWEEARERLLRQLRESRDDASGS